MIIDTDGNLAALRKYEAEVDQKERELEWLMAQTECFFNDIEEAVRKIREIEFDLEHEWTDEINTELEERIGL